MGEKGAGDLHLNLHVLYCDIVAGAIYSVRRSKYSLLLLPLYQISILFNRLRVSINGNFSLVCNYSAIPLVVGGMGAGEEWGGGGGEGIGDVLGSRKRSLADQSRDERISIG